MRTESIIKAKFLATEVTKTMAFILCFGTFKDTNTSARKWLQSERRKRKGPLLLKTITRKQTAVWTIFRTLKDVPTAILERQRELILLMRLVTGRLLYSYPLLSWRWPLEHNTASLRGSPGQLALENFAKATLSRGLDPCNNPIKAPSDNKWTLELALMSTCKINMV